MMLAPDADTTPRGVWHAIAQMEGLQLPDVVGIVQLVEEELSSARDMVRSLEAALTAAKRRRRSTAVSVPAAISSRRATAPEAAAHAELSAVAAARTPHRAQRDHVDRGPMYDDRVARSDVLQQVASSHRQEAAEPDHQMAQEQSAPPSATVDSMFRLLSQPQFCLPGTSNLTIEGLRKCLADALPPNDPSARSAEKLCRAYTLFEQEGGEGGAPDRPVGCADNACKLTWCLR
jgi:hypothetical protein